MEMEWLPAGAKRIEYLESTGTQYIDTGIIPTGNTRAEVYCNIQEYSGHNCVFGGRQSVNSTTFCIFAKSTSYSNGSAAAFNTTETGIGSYNASNFNSDIYIILSSTTAVFGMDRISLTPSSFQGVYPIYIYNLNQGGSSYGSPTACKMKLYTFKLYEIGVLVRNFIPVRIGQVGYLYDKVSKTLFGNSGTGSFILGPDK